jgi:hypothetical protein
MFKQKHLSYRGSNIPFLLETIVTTEFPDSPRWERHLPYLSNIRQWQAMSRAVDQKFLLDWGKMSDELKLDHKYTHSNFTSIFKISSPVKHRLSCLKQGLTFPK